MSTDPLLLVDTGADGVLLNLALAKLMGFYDSDLVPEECKGAGGMMTVHTPKDLAGTEIEIGGKWYALAEVREERPDFASRARSALRPFRSQDDGRRVRAATAPLETEGSAVSGSWPTRALTL